jgi:hypothetical protein
MSIPSAAAAEKLWLSRDLSSLRYLLVLNGRAMRSFSDLSAYPVLPRVVKRIEPLTLRDLSVPVDVAADPDPEHAMLKRRYEVNRYHHSENISHPLDVASWLIRLLPFCRFAWEVNDGWDRGERTVLGIQKLSLGHAEAVPEIFTVPEAFMNVNGFEIAGRGCDFDIGNFGSVFAFIDTHRNLLESETVREQLPSWIDLTFGVTCRGPEAERALNIFNPLSYPESGEPSWMQLCGQVPRQVFTVAHARAAPRGPERPFVFVRAKELRARSRLTSEVQLSGLPFRDELIYTARASETSPNGLFAAISCATGQVLGLCAARWRESVAMRSVVSVSGVRFCRIVEEQMLCLAVGFSAITVFVITAGIRTAEIEIGEEIADVQVSGGARVLVAAGTRVREYSLSGKFVRDVDLEARVSAVGVISGKYRTSEADMVAGTYDGEVVAIAIDAATSELIITRRERVSPNRIRRIDVTEQVTVFE